MPSFTRRTGGPEEWLPPQRGRAGVSEERTPAILTATTEREFRLPKKMPIRAGKLRLPSHAANAGQENKSFGAVLEFCTTCGCPLRPPLRCWGILPGPPVGKAPFHGPTGGYSPRC